MSEIGVEVEKARAHFGAIIGRVCSSCQNNCCHQGTMMGSQDLRRLYKGLQLEAGRRETLVQGLHGRTAEMLEDLKVMRRVFDLLALSLGPERKAELNPLAERIEAWQQFCDSLGGEIDLSPEGLARLVFFSALRSNCLRALRQFEGAEAALVSFARGNASFRMTGRRIAPPRCLFHFGGCLAGRWKPAKCASFFCTGEPNVLQEIAREMSFDEFVLANFTPVTPAELLAAIQLELDLKQPYIEPKVIVGLPSEAEEELTGRLRKAFGQVVEESSPGPFMWSTEEARGRLSGIGADRALLARFATCGGAALYELGVALDGLRAQGEPPAFYLLIERMVAHSPLEHPMWADQMMSQPLGSLDLYAIDGGALQP